MSPEAQATTIAGRYTLGSQLGKGGMGVVWRAEDALLKRQVAIKEIRFPIELQEGESQKIGARVLREARAAAQLNHPGAVGVYDVLQDENRAFIVMELVDAPTLDDIIKTNGPLDEQRAAEVGLALLDTLEAAHAQGIVHRDVKPANVMVPESGTVKLADFGIASVRDDPRLTASGMILGSPAYMAPEQAQEDPGTPATDLWSLGATLYTAVEGRAPFDKGNAIATLGAVLNDAPVFERAQRIRPIIERLMAKDPAERPSLPEARRDLQAVAGGEDSSIAPTAVAAPASITPTRPVTEVRSERVARPREVEPHPGYPLEDSSSKWLIALGAAALIGVLVWLMISGLDDGDERQQARRGSGNSQAEDNDPGAAPVEEGEDGEEAPPEDTEDEQAVPENWTTFTDPATGYEIAYPEGWSIVDNSSNSRDFRDDATGTYMRVAWTDAPGEDVVGRLEEIEADLRSRKEAYERLRLEAVSFLDGWDAGEWEYTYEESGSILHAVNLQFVNGAYGFALNFQTRDQNWDVSQGIFEDFKRSFSPPD